MNSPNLHSDAEYPQGAEYSQSDELDRLVRGALQARVGGEQPPEHVWKRIELGLVADQSSPLPRFRMLRSPLAVQAALTLLLVVILGGVGIQMRLISGDAGRILSSDIPASAATEADENSTSRSLLSPSDEFGVYSLKAHSKAPAVRLVEAASRSYRPAIMPLNVAPAPASVESWSSAPSPPSPNWSLNDGRSEK